jgi:hypothetical protein
MNTEKNKDTTRIRQEELNAKQKEMVESLDNISKKKNRKKESNIIDYHFNDK